jgi:hypothetical protein
VIVPHCLVRGGSRCRGAHALAVNGGERRSVKVVTAAEMKFESPGALDDRAQG